MIASARVMYILNRLNECGVVDYKSIALELGVSEATARRDFEKLEHQGKLKRVQGGAMRSEGFGEGVSNAELTMRYKRNLNSHEKRKIAQRAAELVRDGECVFLDVGTSISPLAEILMHRPVQLITYSNLAVQKFLPGVAAEVFVIGGRYHISDGMFVGPFAEKMLKCFHFQHAFIGCSGVHLESNTVFTTEMECMRMKQLGMEAAERAHLLLDQTKLKKTGLFRVSGLESFETVFIDAIEDAEAMPKNFVMV